MKLWIICLPGFEDSDGEIESSIDDEDVGAIESDIDDNGGESDVCLSYERQLLASVLILLCIFCFDRFMSS